MYDSYCLVVKKPRDWFEIQKFEKVYPDWRKRIDEKFNDDEENEGETVGEDETDFVIGDDSKRGQKRKREEEATKERQEGEKTEKEAENEEEAEIKGDEEKSEKGGEDEEESDKDEEEKDVEEEETGTIIMESCTEETAIDGIISIDNFGIM
jgi:hypothetical protein